MAWTAPMTATANAIFTAAQFNTNVRDNFLETAPAKATTVGSFFATAGTNSISERIPSYAVVTTTETTASGTYVALTTPGPVVTVTTGTSAFVSITAQMSNSLSGAFAVMGFDVSGATTVSAVDQDSLNMKSNSTTDTSQMGWSRLYTGLTPGSNTFTAKYHSTGGGTASFGNRTMTVIPF